MLIVAAVGIPQSFFFIYFFVVRYSSLLVILWRLAVTFDEELYLYMALVSTPSQA